MALDRAAVIKQAKKAFGIAEYSKKLTHRIVATGAKRIIDYSYNSAEHRGKFGYDFSFQNTKRMAKHTADINNGMQKIVKDLLSDVEVVSKKLAKDNIGKVPKDDWDKDAYLASILHGDTFLGRTRKYTDLFKNELLSYIKVGQEENMTADGTLHWYMENYQEPQKDELIIAALAADKIKLEGLSAYRRFARLNDDMIIRGYHTANRYYWQFAEAKYIIAVLDDVTCDICADLDGRVFDVKEDLLPVHAHCRCIEVPILSSRKV